MFNLRRCIAVGVSMVFYNSYLPLMVDDSEEVQDAMAAAAGGVLSDEEARSVGRCRLTPK